MSPLLHSWHLYEKMCYFCIPLCVQYTSSNLQTNRSFLVLKFLLLYIIFRSTQILLLVQNFVKFVLSGINVSLLWINIDENQKTCHLLVKVFHTYSRKFAWWLEVDNRSFTDLTTKFLQGPQYKFYQNQSYSSLVVIIWKSIWHLENVMSIMISTGLRKICQNLRQSESRLVDTEAELPRVQWRTYSIFGRKDSFKIAVDSQQNYFEFCY